MTELFTWTPDSWRNYQAKQQPDYHNIDEFNRVIAQIHKLEVITTATKIAKLSQLLQYVANGEALIIQAGDCAESFSEFSEARVVAFAELLTKMQHLVIKTSNKDVIKLGRIAGQFAKPRSNSSEIINLQILPVYRGDIINGYAANIEERTADPKRMLLAYKQARDTKQMLTKFDTQAVNLHAGYHTTFISHEALLLPYEQAFIRQSNTINWYSGAADSLWIGKRTAEPQSAHIEMLRGIANPIAIKVCADMTSNDLIRIINKINPHNLTAKVMLVIRMGIHINKQLPKLIRAIKQENKSVIWLTDPMHANTYKASNGYKTRSLTAIYAEIKNFLKIIHYYDCFAGGIHLEVSPLDVTECIDTNYTSEEQLAVNYQTLCDPRLNPQQALAVTKFFVTCLQKYQISHNIIS
jgi:3-deoxy-7-phosphoheptulonate synthase